MKTPISFELIVSIVKKGYSDFVVSASRSAGATGATIITGHGTDNSGDQTFMGMNFSPEKEVVLIVVKKLQKKKIMKAILESTDFKKEGAGICFSLPITSVVGMQNPLT